MMGRRRPLLLLLVISFGACVLATPTTVSTISTTDSEGEFLEDPLEKWLANFDTYTFMLEQDVGDKEGAGGSSVGEGETGDEELVSKKPTPFEEEEEGDIADDYEEGSSAPIILKVKKFGSLLDPNLDYKVQVESLVAEGGSVLVTLGSFGNKTECGVGGFSLTPLEQAETSGLFKEPVDITSTISGHPQPEGSGSKTTTIVAVSGDSRAESSTTWTLGEGSQSSWEEHSKDLWWAMGRLGGGGLLTLLFTPPECGCLVVKAYFALPIGNNLTLVVGPEAYPAELEKLLCIDPNAKIEDNLIGGIDDDEGRPEVSEDGDLPVDETSGRPVQVGRGRGKWAAKKRAKLQRKKMRQEARQAIRQAGRKVTKQRIKAHMRQRRRDEVVQPTESGRHVTPGHGGKRARKQARKAARKHGRKGRKSWKGKKPWKKHRKHSRKHRNKHNRRNKHHNKHHNVTEGTEEYYDDAASNETTTQTPMTEEDALAVLLLGEDDEDTTEMSEDAVIDDVVDETDVTSSTVGPVGRRWRKHRRGRGRGARKMKNKDKNKGMTFCCKQGIKFKKSKLVLNSTTETEDEPDISCNNTNDIIITFASHQFAIDSDVCTSRYEKCCTKFTLQLWENVKAKKSERKAKRKQHRKTARQQRRRQNRRLRRLSTRQATSTTPEV